jgi:hypothetical protein
MSSNIARVRPNSAERAASASRMRCVLERIVLRVVGIASEGGLSDGDELIVGD